MRVKFFVFALKHRIIQSALQPTKVNFKNDFFVCKFEAMLSAYALTMIEELTSTSSDG